MPNVPADKLTGIAKALLIAAGASEEEASCFMAVFKVSAFRPLETFRQEVGDFARYLKATPPAKGFTEVYYPGEIEFRNEQARRKNGVPVEDATWNKICELAQGYGLTGINQ